MGVKADAFLGQYKILIIFKALCRARAFAWVLLYQLPWVPKNPIHLVSQIKRMITVHHQICLCVFDVQSTYGVVLTACIQGCRALIRGVSGRERRKAG